MKNFDSINSPQGNSPRINVSASPPASVSLLQKNPQKKSKKLLKRFLGILIVTILVLAGVALSRAMNLSNKIFVGQKTTFFQKLGAVFGLGTTKLVGEDLGQVNILLLGIGGEGHDGPYLTDTMILAQIRPDTGQIALTSIPRDYLYQVPHLGDTKINGAFAEGFGETKDYNVAGAWARQAVEKISGLSIPYFAVVDFSGFEKAINAVGGLDIHVDNTFTDSAYPDEKNGYLPPITFTQGYEHMDAARALEFARSRHSENILEGSDFARSLRQQKVITAFKEKVIALNLISDATKINTLLEVFADHFHTNISPAEILRIYNLAKEKNIKTFLNLSLDPETNIICPEILPDTGAYVLVPCPGKTEDDVKNFFKNAFALGRLYQEKSVVWLGTSTGGKTAYQTASQKLQDAGLTVWEVGFGGQALTQNIVYEVNPKPATAEFIKNTLNAMEVTLPPPGIKIDKSKVDVVVILGQNQN